MSEFSPTGLNWATRGTDTLGGRPSGRQEATCGGLMADARTVQAGSIIVGRYQLTHRIAVGGMGEVWSSTDLALGRSVALKVLLAGHAQDEVTRLRFRAEAKADASVSHPHVVPVFDFGEEADESGRCIDFLLLDHVAGRSERRRVG